MATRNHDIPCLICGEPIGYVTLDSTMAPDEVARRVARAQGPVHTGNCSATHDTQVAVTRLLNEKAQVQKERIDIGLEALDDATVTTLAQRRLGLR